jgi:glycosyltransferase involved in cell wall biosynthesis
VTTPPRDILLAYGRSASFIELDRDLLARLGRVQEWSPTPPATGIPAFLRSLLSLPGLVLRCDVVFAWFASWQTLGPLLLARILRRPSVLVIGGFDVANRPDIGYGAQRRGPRRVIARLAIACARRLITNSYASAREIQANLGVGPPRLRVVHHGVPDPYSDLPDPTRERRVVTVGVVDAVNVLRKGYREFVAAAAQVPDARFALVGRWDDDSARALAQTAPVNLTLTGELSEEDLRRCLGKASVYVQPSRHEGFGMAMAEAMLAGAIPVITRAPALEEVAGDCAIYVDADPSSLAAGIRTALESPATQRARVRQRILDQFPLAKRGAAIASILDDISSITIRGTEGPQDAFPQPTS